MAETSIARAQLEGIKKQVEHDDLRNNPLYDGHRRLIDCAIFSTNGAPDKVVAMAETQGELVAFTVTQSLREPDRLTDILTPVIVSAIRTAIEDHVKTCKGLANLDGRAVEHEAWDANGREIKGKGWEKFKGVMLDNARLIIICLTCMVCAIATRKLPSFGEIVKALVPVQMAGTITETK